MNVIACNSDRACYFTISDVRGYFCEQKLIGIPLIFVRFLKARSMRCSRTDPAEGSTGGPVTRSALKGRKLLGKLLLIQRLEDIIIPITTDKGDLYA